MRTVNIDLLVEIVLKILCYFQTKSDDETSRESDYRYFDIELILREENLYYIRVTNFHYNDVNSQNREFVFLEVLRCCLAEAFNILRFKSYLKTLAFVVKEENDEKEKIYELQWLGKERKTCDVIRERQSENFASHKKYLSLRLEFKILSSNIENFKTSMIAELKKLDARENNAKYVLRSDVEIFWSNEMRANVAIGNCRLVGAAIAEMMKNTPNESFREKCLSLTGANETSEAEEALTREIVSLIGKKYREKRSNDFNNRESRRKRKR